MSASSCSAWASVVPKASTATACRAMVATMARVAMFAMPLLGQASEHVMAAITSSQMVAE
ncbi:hypothetical protein D3C75_1288000 [compost metagenome]